MDVLLQKPKGSIKVWTIAGIIAILAFYVCYVFIDLFYFQAYTDQLGTLDYIGFFITFNGIFTTAVMVFFIGLYASKKKSNFLKFMLWTMMLTGFYFSMPSISNLAQFFTTYNGLDLMYYIGLLLPQLLICVLIVSAILQKDSENTSVTNMIAWVCIVVDVLLLVFQFVYIFSHTENMSSISTGLIAFSGSISIIILICLAFVFLNATKAAVKNGAVKEVALDNLVEKIAKDPKVEESNLEDMVEKISRED